MTNEQPAYISPDDRNRQEQDERMLILTPWTVQNICYEVLRNYMLENSPQSQGFVFAQTYDPDPNQTGIIGDIAYHYTDSVVQKRPAVYVSRGPASYTFPTMNQVIGGGNNRESEQVKFSIVQMPVNLAVVATNVGFAEQLAEYVFKVFLRMQQVIREDFCLRQLKLVEVGSPTLYLESKDHFAVSISLLSVFDMGGIVKGDHLKLKTMSYTVFTNMAEQPLQNQ